MSEAMSPEVPAVEDQALTVFEADHGEHAARLGLLTRQTERIDYVCEVLHAARVNPTTAAVLSVLDVFGHIRDKGKQRSSTATRVNAYRKAHDLADTTGKSPALTPEVLKALDERKATGRVVPFRRGAADTTNTEDAAANTPSEHPNEQRTNTTNTTNSGASLAANTPSEHPAAEANTPSEQRTGAANTANIAGQAANTANEQPSEQRSEHPAPASPVANAGANTLPAVEPEPFKAPKGAAGFYAVAVMAIGVSVDTSFRFFGDKLGIHGVAQYALFTVMEAALIACGWAMAQSVRANRGPGPYRVTAWALCAFAAYAAIDLSGPIEGPARAVLGPALGLVMLHHALGIDKRAARKSNELSTWGRIVWEYRERFLSLLGLGNDSRTALQRTRERAAVRLAYLASAKGWVPLRSARMRRANRLAGTAHDPDMKARVEREHHSLDQLSKLREVKHGEFWNAR